MAEEGRRTFRFDTFGEEIGIDDFQASRAPDGRYRTPPLRGLWTHQKGGFFHDGRFPTLDLVVTHYDSFFGLGLTEQERRDPGPWPQPSAASQATLSWISAAGQVVQCLETGLCQRSGNPA